MSPNPKTKLMYKNSPYSVKAGDSHNINAVPHVVYYVGRRVMSVQNTETKKVFTIDPSLIGAEFREVEACDVTD